MSKAATTQVVPRSVPHPAGDQSHPPSAGGAPPRRSHGGAVAGGTDLVLGGDAERPGRLERTMGLGFGSGRLKRLGRKWLELGTWESNLEKTTSLRHTGMFGTWNQNFEPKEPS